MPNDNTLINEHFSYSDQKWILLRAAADKLANSDKKTDLQTAIPLADWLARPEARAELIDAYTNAFLTQKGEKRKTLFTLGKLHDAEVIDALLDEQQRVYEFVEVKKAAEIAEHSRDIEIVAQALLAEYEAIKRQHAWMDYDDLILSACRLLSRPDISPWVLFKLDGGIDHILVDEAQDTSPEQWQIVDALAQEFFVGESANENNRSLFIVGDEKQSIYSFQGADVSALNQMKKYFTEKIKDAGKPIHHLPITKSYRSTKEILQAVDAVLANPKAREGVSFDGAEISHIVTKEGLGRVEVWDLVTPNCHSSEGWNPCQEVGKDDNLLGIDTALRRYDNFSISPSTLFACNFAGEKGGWRNLKIVIPP